MEKKIQLYTILTICQLIGFYSYSGLAVAGTGNAGNFFSYAHNYTITGLGVAFLFCLVLLFFLYRSQKKLSQKIQADKKTITEISRDLKQSRNHYDELLNRLMDGYIEIDLNGVITNINKIVARTFDCEREELIGQNCSSLLSVTNKKIIDDFCKTILQTKKTSLIKKIDVTGKDNVNRVVEISASLVNNSSQKPVGFRGFIRDITKLSKAEDNQSRLKAQLQRSQKIEAIGTLAGGIAHDFNNLLMAIQGNTSILLFKMEKNNRLYKKLLNIEACIQSGAELTKQLLGFAKGKKSTISILNINELAKETAKTFQRTKKAIQLHEKYSDEIWSVKADQGQLKQVLLNILINSWQTTPDKKQLFIETTNHLAGTKTAQRLGLPEGRYIKLIVSNSESTFRNQPFTGNFKELKTGINAGIGITSSSEVIKSYNGLIEFRKLNADETAYIIYFPVFESTQPPKAVQPLSVQENGTGTILFVDDEEMIIEIGKPMLEELGYDVLVARGGDEAIKVYEVNKGEIDLVILDMVMPRIDGGDVYNILKKINPNVKTLLSSGYSIDERTDALLESGCKGFIQKPFNLKRLSQKIKSALESYNKKEKHF